MELKQGDIMVMDIRTLHHGTANHADQPRTLLYVQYIQDFFVDRGNFPDKQTRAWDELPSTAMRKLLSRIDHQVGEESPGPSMLGSSLCWLCQEYTSQLERMLVQAGVVDGEF